MRRVWPEVASLLEAHGACALVSVVTVRGSAPREAGARMVVGPGRTGFSGTIGGGELEWRVLHAARQALAAGTQSAALDRYSLGPELAQCCGGSVEVLSEVFVTEQLDTVRALAARERAGPFTVCARIGRRAVGRAPVKDGDEGAGDAGTDGEVEIVERFGDRPQEVWLFGAGHVGRALMLALAPLPFAVTWIDERSDAFPPVLPQSIRTIESSDAADELSAAPSGAAVVVMTHSHPLDLAIVHAALAARRFSYVGLIGSSSKRARFVQRLRSAGLPDGLTDALVCPIGLPQIRSKTPAAIATGVAAQLLERFSA